MHELSVCQGLLREVARIAAARQALAVTRITIAIGPLSGIEAPLLARAFSIAQTGTIAADAILETEITAIYVWCENCGVETAAAVNKLVCARCGSRRVQLRSGEELLLKSIELELTTVDDGANDLAREELATAP